MWIDDKNVNDRDMCEVNSFSELLFIKIEMNDLTNWISSFTFIFFINKNNLKDEDDDVNFLVIKRWEAFKQLIKIKSIK